MESNTLYAIHCLLPSIFLEHKQGYLWVKKECIYEWMDLLSKKPLGQRAVAVRRRGGSFPNTQIVWSLLGFDPMRKAKPQTILEHLHFGLCQRPSPLPAPQPHHLVYLRMQLSRWKEEGMPFSHHPLKQGVCEWHIPTALWPTEGSWKWEKQKNHYRMIWKHRAWAMWGIHHSGAEDGITAKRNLV